MGQGQGKEGGAADTVINPYNPNADDDPPEDLGNRCFDFGAGTSYPIIQGGTVVFQVNNNFGGGEPRTPGYWKNWNTCTGGNQQYTATANAEDVDGDGVITGYDRVASGWALLDDILNDPGIYWDDMRIPDEALGCGDEPGCDEDVFQIATCEEGVAVLDQRDFEKDKKRSSDGAYSMAHHLLATQLNLYAGAESCTEVLDANLAGEDLLDAYDFFAEPVTYLRPNSKVIDLVTDDDYTYALYLGEILDQYNNGYLCTP